MSLNRTRIKATLYEDQYTLLIISLSFLLRMRNVSKKLCRENQKTHFVFSIFFFKNLNIYEKIWKNIAEGADHVTIWPIHIACWIKKATNTQTQVV